MRRRAISIFLLVVAASFAGTGAKGIVLQEEWNKTYGGDGYDVLYCVKETGDGYIAVGDSVRNGIPYAWAVKVDKNGNLQWEKLDIQNSDLATYVEETEDGYIICGWINENNVYRSYAWKLSGEGETQWLKEYSDISYLYKIVELDDGYLFVGGKQLSSMDCDGILLKTDFNGNIIWKKTYRYGERWDCLRTILKVDDGYILGGVCGSDEYGDVWILKVDNNGNLIWQKHYGGSKFDGIWSRECLMTDDGGFIFGASTGSYGAGDVDIWLIKTDGNGNMIWNKTYGGKKMDMMWGMGKATDGYLLCITKNYGAFARPCADIWIVKVDENGDMVWNQTFGGSKEDRGYYIQSTEDGGYIVAGRTESFSNSSEGWLIKVKNVPPNKPSRPQGPSDGKINVNYTYSVVTVESNNDEIYYMWDWGDNTTSQWIGPFKSGEVAEASHTWKEKGTYNIRVKAKDASGLESPWSDPLVVSMPKNLNAIQELKRFPILYILLDFLLSLFTSI